MLNFYGMLMSIVVKIRQPLNSLLNFLSAEGGLQRMVCKMIPDSSNQFEIVVFHFSYKSERIGNSDSLRKSCQTPCPFK